MTNETDKPIAVHELRTPLHAIRGASELLLDGSVGRLTGEARDVIGLIVRACDELSKNVDIACELVELTARPAAYLARVGLRQLLADMVPTAHLAVQVDSDWSVEIESRELERAVALSCRLIVHTGGSTCVLERLDKHGVVLAMGQEGGRLAAGEGALIWALARGRAARAGASLQLAPDGHIQLHLKPAGKKAPAGGSEPVQHRQGG